MHTFSINPLDHYPSVLSPMQRRNRVRQGKHSKNRIIKTIVKNGREFQLHATKGWRNYRAS